MAKLHTVLLATCAVLLALAAPLLTGDPDMFQDICVADFKSLQGPLSVNGYPCKREMNVTVDDFFGGLAKAADVYSGNPMGQGRIHRIDRNVGEDPHLEIFKREWFEGQDCIDIGCNQGLVTIGLGLIETANWNLRRISPLHKVATKNVKVPKPSDPPSQSSPEEVAPEMSNGIFLKLFLFNVKILYRAWTDVQNNTTPSIVCVDEMDPPELG